MTLGPERQPRNASTRSLWLPVTVRVAWELVNLGVNPRPRLVHDARLHVLLSLPPGIGAARAERLSGPLTRDFLERTRRGTLTRVEPAPELPFTLDPSWRERIAEVLDNVGDAVFRLHYGDGLSLGRLEHQVAVDLLSLETARSGLREIARTVVGVAHGSVLEWPDARVDELLVEIANQVMGGCPGPVGLLSDVGRAHADRCPRCSRAVRLIRGGVLSHNDLFPQEGAPETGSRALVALVLHPDARGHRGALQRALRGRATAVSPDAWIVDEAEIEAVGQALVSLAGEGRPPRERLRAARVEGAGRWLGATFLGPLPLNALDAARGRAWGELDVLGPLPAQLPPAPALSAFLGVALLSLALALGAGMWAFSDPPPLARVPLTASFSPMEGGWVARFDADDLAVVDLVTLEGGRPHLSAGASAADKAGWATGEGDYLLRAESPDLLLLASPHGLPALRSLVAAAPTDQDPLLWISREVQEIEPSASVIRSPRPAVDEAQPRR